MSKTEENLKGNNNEKANTALLLVDLINDLEFEGGDKLAANLFPLIQNLVDLKRRAKEARIPVIYVNDNFGRWQSDFRKLLDHCLNDKVRGTPLVRSLAPEQDDYFVLKPKHSGFYSTTLDMLLSYLGVKYLILAGITGDQCILLTAGDAHMRDFRLVVPSDCVASQTNERNRYALELIKQSLDANIGPAGDLNFKEH